MQLPTPPELASISSEQRPLIKALTKQLAKLIEKHSDDPVVLHHVYVELLYRRRQTAKRLRKELESEFANAKSYFKWPDLDAEPKAPAAASRVSPFVNSKGLLGFMGYRVGAVGLTTAARRALLDDVVLQRLPKCNTGQYMRAWGLPKTPRRLKRLANELARLIRTRARNNADGRYALSIDEWQGDLEYLKTTYYKKIRSEFVWPMA
jgi:hypothetical protein